MTNGGCLSCACNDTVVNTNGNKLNIFINSLFEIIKKYFKYDLIIFPCCDRHSGCGAGQLTLPYQHRSFSRLFTFQHLVYHLLGGFCLFFADR